MMAILGYLPFHVNFRIGISLTLYILLDLYLHAYFLFGAIVNALLNFRFQLFISYFGKWLTFDINLLSLDLAIFVY